MLVLQKIITEKHEVLMTSIDIFMELRSLFNKEILLVEIEPL